MKLSEYIDGLKTFLNNYGDLECYYAVDDEGNYFVKTSYCGTLCYIPRRNKDRHKTDELYTEEDIVEYEMEDTIQICVVN